MATSSRLRKLFLFSNVFKSKKSRIFLCEVSFSFGRYFFKDCIRAKARFPSPCFDIHSVKLLMILGDIFLGRRWLLEHNYLPLLEEKIMEKIKNKFGDLAFREKDETFIPIFLSGWHNDINDIEK